jgi:general secretion pathway protein G
MKIPPTAARVARSTLRAFTMMELLVVLAILGLLAGLAISNVGSIFGDAQASTAKLFVKETMKTALFTYRMRVGSYPTTAEGLQALVTPPADKADRWGSTPYIEGGKIPLDPWNQPYQYACPGTHNKDGYDLWSKGPPEKPTEIGNWDDAPAGAAK